MTRRIIPKPSPATHGSITTVQKTPRPPKPNPTVWVPSYRGHARRAQHWCSGVLRSPTRFPNPAAPHADRVTRFPNPHERDDASEKKRKKKKKAKRRYCPRESNPLPDSYAKARGRAAPSRGLGFYFFFTFGSPIVGEAFRRCSRCAAEAEAVAPPPWRSTARCATIALSPRASSSSCARWSNPSGSTPSKVRFVRVDQEPLAFSSPL